MSTIVAPTRFLSAMSYVLMIFQIKSTLQLQHPVFAASLRPQIIAQVHALEYMAKSATAKLNPP